MTPKLFTEPLPLSAPSCSHALKYPRRETSCIEDPSSRVAQLYQNQLHRALLCSPNPLLLRMTWKRPETAGGRRKGEGQAERKSMPHAIMQTPNLGRHLGVGQGWRKRLELNTG